jgi:HEAT repeat protein
MVMDKRRIQKLLLRALGVVALLAAAAFIIFFLVVLPQMDIAGAVAPLSAFEFRKELAVARTGPGGVSYSLNNSTATFDLDVLCEDGHGSKLFPDYASALRYCKANGLATIPSVQLIQGKLKQLDDRLCAALEAAVQAGPDGGKILGKKAALQRLLKKLLEVLERAPQKHRATLRAAVVHVATALELGGAKTRVPRELAGEVRSAKDKFLARPLASRPIGFWDGSDELKGIFRQDRYLSKGLKLSSSLPVCMVLAATVAADSVLAASFARLRRFDSKLCGAPVYIDPDAAPAAPARCVSCPELAGMLPGAKDALAVLDAKSREAVKVAAARKFGPDAGFALVSYAQSSEYNLLYELGAVNASNTMQLMIDAVRSGRLKLKPKPDSGWYAYQWYALETLLVPDRAREAPKLRMSDHYRLRLENAFKTSLTKHRETHIKHLPVITLGMFINDEPPVPVEVAPEFRVEPTATVYLRYARAYRFLHNAMRGVLGATALRGIRVGAAGRTADRELRRATLLCYGLYEGLCFDLGHLPDYLPDEMTAEDRAAARKEAARWLAGLTDDPDLAADTRFAAPICTWPGGPVRYWGTGGVRLERVEYRYRRKPRVTGNVDPTLVPAVLYLPTDIFLEFERRSPVPLTRREYRALCDAHADEDALRLALGAAPRPRRAGIIWPILGWCLAAVLAVALVWRFRKFMRTLWARRPKRLLLKSSLAAVGFAVLFLVLFFSWPRFRVKFLVKYFAPINVPAGLIVEARMFNNSSLAEIDALADMLSDEDPQVRYLASRYLTSAWSGRYGDEETATKIPGLKERLQAAANDDVPDVAANALFMLGDFNDEQNVEFLLRKLRDARNLDILCWRTVFALGQTGSPRALDAILPFAQDRRRMMRWAVLLALGKFPDERAATALEKAVCSDNQRDRSWALSSITSLQRLQPAWKLRFDRVLLTAARRKDYRPYHRFELASGIEGKPLRAEAYLTIFRAPSSHRRTSEENCREEAYEKLAELCPGRKLNVERLAELTRAPDVDLAELAAMLLKVAPYELTLIAEKPLPSADLVCPAIDITDLGVREWDAPTLYWGLKLVWDGKVYARTSEHMGAWGGPLGIARNSTWRTSISVTEYTVPAGALAPGKHTMAVQDDFARSNTIVVVIAGKDG